MGYPGYRLLGLEVHDRAHAMQRLAWRLFLNFRNPLLLTNMITAITTIVITNIIDTVKIGPQGTDEFRVENGAKEHA